MPSNRGSDSLYRYILMLHTYVKDTPNQDTLWVGDLGKPHKLDSKHKNSRPKPRCTPDPNSDLYPKPLSLSMHVCLNLCLYPSLSLSPYLCLPIYVYIYLYLYIYMYIYTYTYIYISDINPQLLNLTTRSPLRKSPNPHAIHGPLLKV